MSGSGWGLVYDHIFQLPEAERLAYANANMSKLTIPSAVSLTAKTLPQKQRLKFLCEAAKNLSFPNVPILISLVRDNSILDDIEFDEFLKSQLDRIITSSKLLKDLLYSSGIVTPLSWINSHSNLIEDITPVLLIIKSLPESNRFDFAKQYKDRIADVFDLYAVLNLLAEHEKLPFTLLVRGVFHNNDDVIYLLEKIPTSDRLGFLKQCHFTLLNDLRFNKLLTLLSPSDLKAVLELPRLRDRLGLTTEPKRLLTILAKLSLETVVHFIRTQLDGFFASLKNSTVPKTDVMAHALKRFQTEYPHLITADDSLDVCIIKINQYHLGIVSQCKTMALHPDPVSSLIAQFTSFYTQPLADSKQPACAADVKQQPSLRLK